VMKCQSKIDNTIYAIKKTRRKINARNKGQTLNEAFALASLTSLEDNPHIVRYYHSWVEDDRLYVVMEYCPRSLKEMRKNQGHFSESDLRKVLRDICLGLKYLHKQNIIHLDIKPENILCSTTNKYKIADLGQSRLVSGQKSDDIQEGDGRYVAPELLMDFTDPDYRPDYFKADIFSLGMTLYELATNSDSPNTGDEFHQLRNGIFEKLDNLNGVSNFLKNIIKRMLNRDPTNRPTAQELLTLYLPSEVELELKWEKTVNYLLIDKIKSYEKKAQRKRTMSLEGHLAF